VSQAHNHAKGDRLARFVSDVDLPPALEPPSRGLVFMEGQTFRRERRWSLIGTWRLGSWQELQRNSFQWLAKGESISTTRPPSGPYLGQFEIESQTACETHDECDLHLTFEDNVDGGFNVQGYGSNCFFSFSIVGVLNRHNHFRVVKIPPLKSLCKKIMSGNVRSSTALSLPVKPLTPMLKEYQLQLVETQRSGIHVKSKGGSSEKVTKQSKGRSVRCSSSLPLAVERSRRMLKENKHLQLVKKGPLSAHVKGKGPQRHFTREYYFSNCGSA